MSADESKLVEVYRTPKLAAAHGMRMELESEGIPVLLDGEMLQGSLGELPMGWATALRILVDASFAKQATFIVEQIEARQRDINANRSANSETCLACGQPLQPSETRCSACGWTFLQQPEARLDHD
jgi:transposase